MNIDFYHIIYDLARQRDFERILQIVVDLHLKTFPVTNTESGNAWDSGLQDNLKRLFSSPDHTNFTLALELIQSFSFKKEELRKLLINLYHYRLKDALQKTSGYLQQYDEILKNREKFEIKLNALEKIKATWYYPLVWNKRKKKQLEQEIIELEYLLSCVRDELETPNEFVTHGKVIDPILEELSLIFERV